MAQKRAYFAFKISNKGFTYLDTKIGENKRIFDGLKITVVYCGIGEVSL